MAKPLQNGHRQQLLLVLLEQLGLVYPSCASPPERYSFDKQHRIW
jgi:hypothetical protein